MSIRRGKKLNELAKMKEKILDYVKNGDNSSAAIYIQNYINDENKIRIFDVLGTMCDQLKGRIKEVESFGVTDDI